MKNDLPEQYKNAVLTKDNDLENFMIKLSGKAFFCECHCNVFHKPDKSKLSLYACNSCGMRFEAE